LYNVLHHRRHYTDCSPDKLKLYASRVGDSSMTPLANVYDGDEGDCCANDSSCNVLSRNDDNELASKTIDLEPDVEAIDEAPAVVEAIDDAPAVVAMVLPSDDTPLQLDAIDEASVNIIGVADKMGDADC
jgi:hypothetical protein